MSAAPLPASARQAAAPMPVKINPEVRQWETYLGLLGQLALLVFAIFFFRIENEAFQRLAALAAGGFAIHYLLPLRYRQPFFVALSLAGLFLVLGPQNAAWVIGLGLVILGLAHLPVSIYARAAILLAVGLALAVPRWGLGQVPWSPAIWPILGSLFVFRLLSYLYERHHGLRPTGPAQVLAYFFLLPNVSFPLFPIIDFKRFVRSYYDADRHGIYQVGVEWIWRGLIQLVVYRLVYFQLTLDPVEVANVADLAIYMLSTYLLYVRLSGYFHIVTGILHLFGFNLPETHHRYFLASSFTDYWRRINIYWKDFMMKLFYYPAFFRLRKLGDTKALVVSTIVTFVATWCLHMVQWFWIRGSVLVEWNDIIFWSLFAGLVLANSLYESKHGRTRTLSTPERTWSDSALVVAKTVATFTTICVMWSFWSAESATDWGLMVSNAMTLPAWPAGRWVALVLVVVGALGLWSVALWKNWGTTHPPLTPTVSRAQLVVTMAALCLLTAPMVTTRLPQQAELLDSLRLASASALNRRDAEEFQRGYYENLVDVSKFNTELWVRYQQMPQDFVRSLSRLGLTRLTEDELDYELLPHKEGRFVGAMVRTNQWGMRDRDYSLERPPGVYRIAMIGPSTAMGSGVEAHETFEALLEDQLNRQPGPPRYELLNFGVAGYSPIHMLYQLERRVMDFAPQAVLFLAHANDLERTSRQMARLVRRNAVPKGSFLAEVQRDSGVEAHTRPTEARRRLKPYVLPLQEWVYRQVVEKAKARGAVPLFVYMETVTERSEAWRAEDRTAVLGLARKAGFRIIDLTGAYGSYTQEELWIAPNDGHPNALGNRLLAQRIYDQMEGRPERFLATTY
jgi:D-alanyl-lipoteichoic acid acyltransferase DltB (MBOAT superfamily)